MNTRTTGLKQYLEEIRKNPPLRPEEEGEVIVQAQAGDKTAQDKLIKTNLGFVLKVAREYENKDVPLEVLVNEGIMGLYEAITRYDPTKGTRLILYAAWWIRNHIRQSIADQTHSYSIPVKKIDQESKVRDTWAKFEQKFGRRPTVFELADELGVKESEVVEIIKVYSNLSLNYPERGTIPYRFQLPVEEMEDIEAGDLAIKRLVILEINEMLGGLDKKEADILSLYFGINQEKRFTLEEIGALYNISKERVRQVRENALKKLRNDPKYKKLEIFMNWILESQ